MLLLSADYAKPAVEIAGFNREVLGAISHRIEEALKAQNFIEARLYIEKEIEFRRKYKTADWDATIGLAVAFNRLALVCVRLAQYQEAAFAAEIAYGYYDRKLSELRKVADCDLTQSRQCVKSMSQIACNLAVIFEKLNDKTGTGKWRHQVQCLKTTGTFAKIPS